MTSRAPRATAKKSKLAMRLPHISMEQWRCLIAVVEEQAQSLLRTAFGTITREAGDLSAGVYDVNGNMIAQAMTGPGR